MAYIKDTYTFTDSIEVDIKFAGRYGAKGETRNKRKNVTPEVIQKQNQRNREIKYRRTIKANFKKGDLWVTFTYPGGTRLTMSQVKKDIKNLTDNVRKHYKKRDTDFKWIKRIEIGRNGGVHVHMLINRLRGDPSTEEIISGYWKVGRAHFEIFNGASEDAHKIADYVTKQLTDGQKKKAEEQGLPLKEMTSISTSKNLVRPVPVRKKYARRTVRRIIENGPTPHKGFVIDKNSLVFGENPFTGLSYCKYIEIRADGGELP
ncbi:rolling circle replication-associated protein [Pseudobutyrivibrio sp.]|uniref:rolling circle replication-associated protein n=1 Tax=Pseudobutyrivibrio sp. TaxID=2014367 RepID=UPI001DD446DE|nr:hypothetical protein [Pseudobutyrivibrio sp.]MBE5910915.1 hypothetical protein [Pseudobutyrivibrio sp.]